MFAPAHHRFYELYDKNRQGLLEVYTDFSFFSLTTGALERLSEKEKQKNLSEYLQASRNLLKVRASQHLGRAFRPDRYCLIHLCRWRTWSGGWSACKQGA